MKLITKALEKLFAKYPTYSQDGKMYDAVVIAKFFMPWSSFTWYVTEACKLTNGDYEFFGYVDGIEGEFGYFTLSELQSLRGRFGLRVERDRYFDCGKTTLAKVLNKSNAEIA
ncbi:MAG: DUF2958 domain-containing protein [Bacteroides sp.]|nr:DUF2958 domain-containing protein [Bacteroides sp.]